MNKQRWAGVVFLLIPALLVWLSIAVYDKRFTRVSMVTLETGTAGSEMHPYADVKLRGVRVGEVREIDADGSGARLALALEPDKLRLLPANVLAQLLPTTLFGTRYVALIPPEQPSAERLRPGGTIGQDRSQNAVELQQVLDNLLPLLQAVQPAKLSATLTAIAQALDGRGQRLGRTLVELDAYLKKLNPSLPALNRGIRELVELTGHYGEAVPDLITALSDLTVTSRTLAAQKANLALLYDTVTSASQDFTDFLKDNSETFIRLSARSKPTLRLFAKYSPEFPCTLRTLTEFIPKMNEVLGKDTGRPGVRVRVRTVPDPGAYQPGKDKPAYTAKSGPACYPVPYTTAKVARGGLGPANSPQENSLLNELIAPELGEPAQVLPDWSSVLIGPLYRGAEVTVG
ncbi:MCE family protein [Actinocorallia populi]|uniref:MCE family protein n=1 Tax=Actinocorallia populi TaxID=2079200 RepID=UPI000D089A1E|nr:MCE family protein [Actinocorallia populi]